LCNHYGNNIDKLPSWREWAGYNLKLPAEPFAEDVYPKRKALVVRREAGETLADVMTWGIVRKMPGKRPGTFASNAVTNVRNFSSPFWKSTLANPFTAAWCPSRPLPSRRSTRCRLARRGSTGSACQFYPVGAFAGIWRGSERGIDTPS
jgi:hypothetical protein